MDGSARVGRHFEALRNYKSVKKLGSGAFGKVKIAEHKFTGRKVAIKIINYKIMRENKMEENAKREIKILKLLIHPHIIRVYEVIDTPTDIYVVMEYCEHGDLHDYITSKRRLQEAEARRIFQQIVSAVEYCHRNMVAHRDLKPENLLLDSEYNVKLADFGLSNFMHDGHFLKTNCGSRSYAAPEILFGKHYAGPEVDVWSCGVILYALLCGKLPFDDANISNRFRNIKGDIYTLPSHLSSLTRHLISRMLVFDTMERITIPEIREHPWFQMGLPLHLALSPDISQKAKMLPSTESASSSTRQALPGSSDLHRYRLQPLYTTETKWALGLQSSDHARPHEIMAVVLEALRELNACWKENGLYNMKCKWCRRAPLVHDMVDVNSSFPRSSTFMETDDSNGRPPAVIKFEMQIYKTTNNKYLLDTQRLTGPPLLFLDFCAAFFAKLRVL